eukprot:TRINITY_DN13760_c1_g3_i1.p1 TRINITY_DN13760_c1_g3~~TRINITY_DN13760_c1_g3_i1.p1  ORF type:complete len:331 (+),score=63.05 TRINITY_DN13760_c1_g3_i1:63-1055(+)
MSRMACRAPPVAAYAAPMFQTLARLPMLPAPRWRQPLRSRRPASPRGGGKQLALRWALQRRCITIWPQWPHDQDSTGNAKLVGDPEFRWPPRPPPKPEPALELRRPADVAAARMDLQRRIWRAMKAGDWGLWERLFWELRDRRIPHDEATYAMLIHGYLLSHRHSAENAFVVLEEMRQAEVHPALVRLQERLVRTAFDLKELDARPDGLLWLHLVRMSWYCARRFQKKRQRRLRNELSALAPDEVLALQPNNAVQWLQNHDRLELPPSDGSAEGARARFLPQRPPALRALEGGHAGQRRLAPSSSPLSARREGGGGRRGRGRSPRGAPAE